MYRLVKFPRFKISRPQMYSSQVSVKFCSCCGIHMIKVLPNVNRGMLKEDKVNKRNHGTNTNINFVNELMKRKRFKKDKRYFTELLEVFSDTQKRPKDTKAIVKKLKPGEVSRFVSNPDIDLAHLYSIKKKDPNELYIHIHKSVNVNINLDYSSENVKANNKSTTLIPEMLASGDKFYSNDRNVENPPGLNEEARGSASLSEKKVENEMDELGQEINTDLISLHEPPELSVAAIHPHFQEIISEEPLIEEDMDNEPLPLQALKVISPLEHSEDNKRKVVWKRKRKEKLVKENMSDLEKMCQEKAFNMTLFTYLTVCVSCNFLHRAYATLCHYLRRSKLSTKRTPKVTDIRCFEVVLQGFAAKGTYHKVNELWNMLTLAKIEPTTDIFKSRLESAARSYKHKNKIPTIIEEIKNSGYDLNDIFVKSTFLGDQRDVILKAVQELEPQFEPKVILPNICYSCSLLEELNQQQGKNFELQSPAKGLFDKTEMQKIAKEQMDNEFLFHMKVKSIEKNLESEGVLNMNRQKLNSMRDLWLEDLQKGFEREVSVIEQLKRPNTISLLPYLKVLDTKDYIDIMMKEIQRLAEGSETFSPTTSQLHRYLGNQIKNRYIVKHKQATGIVEKTKMLYDKYCDWYLDPSANNCRSSNGRQEWQQLLHQYQNGPSIVGEEDYWPSTVVQSLGTFLYNIIISDVKVDVNVFNKTNKQHMLPAFYRVYRQQNIKVVEEIKPHPVISKLIRAAAEEHLLFDINLVPMLAPPLPWTSHNSGGYLMSKADLIRLPDQALQQRQRLKEAPPEQLYPSLDSLNQLGSIPWRVNKPVLDTVIEVFNSGGSDKLEIPEPPHLCPMAEPVNPSMSKQERFQAYRQRMLLRRQKAEMYSLWCDALYKLSLANHFRDKTFWLPHNMDFRGRVYPCPPHLNHLGADMPRSLLCFAQGKALGPSGLDWLKIHLVNLLGTKKRESIQDRLNYANDILTDILDSAEKPLTGRKWWMESETPWQTLACCMEIKAALEHPEGPEKFVSHYPVHQDGSCNGLQHYAALGRDHAGACSVNLMSQELPQDVYSCVAALVERERAKDSAAGVKVAQELDGFVRRKVIKQTVMTTVYGVTRFGARLQIAKQLKDIDSFPKECVWPASTYLVTKTFESLREMFNSTKEIQDWFTECARLVSQVRGENMEYVTPLGLPVVQYYCRPSKKLELKANKFGAVNEYFPIDMFERPNVMKQKNAFPPNFIHSLDSSHMMLTSIFSEQKGITFVSVHDCYWTHASSVHIMNEICRKQFVALHSQPILENLSQFMLSKYGFDKSELVDQDVGSQAKQKLQTVLAQVPPKGTFVLENVLDSVYFFS